MQQFLSKTYGIDERAISVAVEEVPKERWDAVMAEVSNDTLIVKPRY